MTRKIILWLTLLATILFLVYSYLRFKDRHPQYWLDLQITAQSLEPTLAGFAKRSINPNLIDVWTDKNRDAVFRLTDGDSFEDRNGNGAFDAVWMAGFQNQRPAQGIHDTLWARSFAIQKDSLSIAVIAIDAIGLGNDEILTIRKAVQSAVAIDYVVVSSTHSHQTPDLIGMWGPGDYRRGVQSAYLQLVIDQCIEAAVASFKARKKVRFRFVEDLTYADDLVEDSRKPIVKDAGLRVIEVQDLVSGQTLGTLVGWANHPETLWSDNLMISCDFPHYLRKGIEEGVIVRDSLLQRGIGGISIFINGAIGGLMTSSPRFAIADLLDDTIYLAPSFDKAKAQGDRLALRVLQMLEQSNVDTLIDQHLVLSAKSLSIPMENKLFRLGAWLGILERGMIGWFKLRSEIAFWQLDDIGFLHIPGEIYPEIINGGIESPPGQDFAIDPVEIPPLRDLVSCRSTFVVGLSNDMIGYIIPKSEWDEHPPYLYHEHDSPYGEINSLGPETAPIIHQAVSKLLSDLDVGSIEKNQQRNYR